METRGYEALDTGGKDDETFQRALARVRYPGNVVGSSRTEKNLPIPTGYHQTTLNGHIGLAISL